MFISKGFPSKIHNKFLTSDTLLVTDKKSTVTLNEKSSFIFSTIKKRLFPTTIEVLQKKNNSYHLPLYWLRSNLYGKKIWTFLGVQTLVNILRTLHFVFISIANKFYAGSPRLLIFINCITERNEYCWSPENNSIWLNTNLFFIQMVMRQILWKENLFQ